MENNISDLIEEIATYICKKKLEVPAILFLELNKPLSLFYSSMFVVSTPIVGMFMKPEKMKKLYLIMEKRENIEALLKRIETLSTPQPPFTP